MRSAVVGAIGISLLWLTSVPDLRADPPAAAPAPARDAPALPAPFAPLEVLLAATDLVVEGTIAAPPAPRPPPSRRSRRSTTTRASP